MYPGWSAPLFFANPENRFSHAEDKIIVYHVVLFGVVFYALNLYHRIQMKRLSMYIKKKCLKKGRMQLSGNDTIKYHTRPRTQFEEVLKHNETSLKGEKRGQPFPSR